MRRKQQQAGPLSPASVSDDGAPKSPASTGAMDDLLQKLRAAKPEARDQRDRRRRARLKDRHQVRVASGQQIPDIGVNVEDDASVVGEEGEAEKSAGKGMLSPTSETAESETNIGAVTSPTTPGADVADRAAAMLEGLQRPDATNKDGSLSVRRRRDNADSERERRRRRRLLATSKASEDGGLMSPSIAEEDGASDAGSIAGDRPATRDGLDERPVTRDGSDDMPTTPTTVVVPPSPEQKGRDLPTPPPDEA